MNNEVNENWINTYIKNNPFRFKETIIHQCRQMDKADVYEWLADNEAKIILLQQKVNRLESTLNKVREKIKLERKISLGLEQVYTISVLDQLQNILNEVGGSNE